MRLMNSHNVVSHALIQLPICLSYAMHLCHLEGQTWDPVSVKDNELIGHSNRLSESYTHSICSSV